MALNTHVFKDPKWLTTTAVNLITGNLVGTAQDLAKTLTQSTLAVGDQLIDCYQQAMGQLLADRGEHFQPELSPAQRADLDLSQLNPDFPTHHPLFAHLMERVRAGVSGPNQHPTFFRRLREDFPTSLMTLLRDQDHQPVRDYLEAYRQWQNLPENQLNQHTNQVLQMVGSEPLPMDPDLTLHQIYVQPEALYWPETDEKKDTYLDEKQEAHSVPLVEHLVTTLHQSKAPIILHGDPGHGKSSSMRMLVHALVNAMASTDTILFYEFKHLRQLARNEFVILGEQTSFLTDEAFFHNRQTVLILDGMDERQVTDGTERGFKEFVRHLFTLAGNINKRADGSRLQLLLTGRSQFVSGVKDAFGRAYHQYQIRDFDQGRIEDWLTRFASLKNLSEPPTYNSLVAAHFKELIGQPILLTMTAQLMSDPEGKACLAAKGGVSRGNVYQTIIEWTHAKRWHGASSGHTFACRGEDYERLLQAIAYAMFRHGQETIKVSALKEALADPKSDFFELAEIDGFKEYLPDFCRELAVSFYFKGWAEQSFSFIHKSLGDYLTVRAMFTALKAITDACRSAKDRDLERMADEIYDLLGRQPLSRGDHLGFMGNVASAHLDDCADMMPKLRRFFQMAHQHRFMAEQTRDRDANPILKEANVLHALVTWVAVMFEELRRKNRLAEAHLEVFASKSAPRHYCALLEASPAAYFHYLKNVVLIEADLSLLFLFEADLGGADLSGAYLSGAYLSGAYLSGANLRGADLRRSYLSGADLRGANLRSADLRSADLSGADLGGADLRRAYLRSAHLYRANFNDVTNWKKIKNIQDAHGLSAIQDPPEGFHEWVAALRKQDH